MLNPFRLAGSSSTAFGALQERTGTSKSPRDGYIPHGCGHGRRHRKNRIHPLQLSHVLGLTVVVLASLSPRSAAAPTAIDNAVLGTVDIVEPVLAREADAQQATYVRRGDDATPTNDDAAPALIVSSAATSTFESVPVTSAPSLASNPSASTSPTSSAPTSITTFILPQPFDGIIWTNFTQPSCPTFFQSFVNDAAFKSCLPFSLLLKNSISFFQAAKFPSVLKATLDATCNVNYASCALLMSSLAAQLRSNCEADYNLRNPLARYAYDGFVSYPPLYNATCLKTPPNSSGNSSSDYCYLSAVQSALMTADLFLYYLPLGFALPQDSKVTCSSCTQRTMSIFAAAVADQSSPLSGTYNAAAAQIDATCGGDFVNASVKSSRASTVYGSRHGAAGLCLMVLPGLTLAAVSWWLLL